MYSEFQLLPILILLAAGQGLFLSLALILSKAGNYQANRYLGFFTFLITVTALDNAFDLSNLDEDMLFLRTAIYSRDFLYGPVLYFYIREMTLPGKYRLKPRQWLHFLPGISHVAILLFILLFAPSLYHAIMLESVSVSPEVVGLAGNLLSVELASSVIQLSIYLWLCVRVLKGHRERCHAVLSFDEKVNLNWLNRLLYGVILLYFVWIFDELFNVWGDLEIFFSSLLGTGLIILIYTMSYLGLRQPVIFSRRVASLVISDQGPNESASEKYVNSPLSDDLSQKLVEELQQLMIEKQPFLNSQLSLPELADQLGVSVHYLSQIINAQLGQNFFDFINQYRIDLAKIALKDTTYKNSNILTIAHDVGFNSKSSFYTAFKKYTGKTPGEFRNTNQ